MLVSFEQVAKVQPSAAAPINSGVSIALGPITGGTRSTLYDPFWGYYLFGQSLRMDYHDARTYMDRGEFSIEGEFTISAENATAGNVASTEDNKFLRVVAKYEALEAAFHNAGAAVAPNDFSQWGTAADPRVIALPNPLVDSGGNTIYALPQELEVQESQWGNYIHYRAVLREAKFSPGKVTVNGQVIDDGIITFNCPAPIMTRTALIGCAGELIQVDNYTMAELQVDGSISGIHASGHSLTDYARNLLPSLMTDYVNIGVAYTTAPGTVTYTTPFPGFSLDEGSGVEVDYDQQVVRIAIKAKAGQF